MLAVVVSRADSASEHVGERLLELGDWAAREDRDRPDSAGGATYYRTEGAELRVFDELHLHLERVGAAFDDPDLLAFAARHAGDSGQLLTAHTSGNVGPAEFGGRANELPRAAPNALAVALDSLAEHAPHGYDTGLECTHHGPSRVGCPSLFVEVGSAEDQWADPAAARAVARSILALRGVDPDRERTLVGFGGGHYAPRFTRIVRETDWAVGHVVADWSLDALAGLAPQTGQAGEGVEMADDGDVTDGPGDRPTGDGGSGRDGSTPGDRDGSTPGDRDGSTPGDRDGPDIRGIVRQVFEQSGATWAVVDGDRPEIEAVAEEVGFRIVSETWARQTTNVPLEFVRRVESELATVDDGLRFGDPARNRDGWSPGEGFVNASLAGELLEAANGIDRERVLAAVEERALAYETGEGASTFTGGVALPDVVETAPPEDSSAPAGRTIVDALVEILRAKYDRVELGDGEVVARREAFDPDRARDLGIEEGPAFGTLAAGEPVELDGRTVSPDAVRVERTERFDVPISYRG